MILEDHYQAQWRQKSLIQQALMELAMGRPHVGRNCGVYLGAKGVDRAKDARIGAKKARDKRKNRNFQERDVVLQEFLK